MPQINEPCPYCKNPKPFLEAGPTDGVHEDHWTGRVTCVHCHRMGPIVYRKTQEEAQLEAIRGWKC